MMIDHDHDHAHEYKDLMSINSVIPELVLKQDEHTAGIRAREDDEVSKLHPPVSPPVMPTVAVIM